uniref:Uncharacterized protein n=1 Tax=Glossina brevipalpis TaxID=37001 RepID=A0A1A9W3M0_9MUSC
MQLSSFNSRTGAKKYRFELRVIRLKCIGDPLLKLLLRSRQATIEVFHVNGGGNVMGSKVAYLAGGDSLLEAANMRLEEYQKLLNIKTKLEKELNLSNEKLKTATDENRKIW